MCSLLSIILMSRVESSYLEKKYYFYSYNYKCISTGLLRKLGKKCVGLHSVNVLVCNAIPTYILL